jgi:hypothetical protein
MSNYEAPHVDGVMELEVEQKATIKEKLVAIQESFVASHEQPICDTFYLVSTYNKENPNEVINGDTAADVLRPVEVIEPPIEEETPEAPIEEAAPIENPAE